MPIINLRTHYPHCTEDIFIEVSDEVAEIFLQSIRAENAYQRKKYRHKAQYSLDVGDGIENAAIHTTPSPEEILIEKQTLEQLYNALSQLTKLQSRRIYDHYILRKKKVEIARNEGTCGSSVCCSIRRGLKNLQQLLKDMNLEE